MCIERSAVLYGHRTGKKEYILLVWSLISALKTIFLVTWDIHKKNINLIMYLSIYSHHYLLCLYLFKGYT